MLEAPQVPNPMMEIEEGRMMPEAAVKQKKEEVAQGRWKWRRDEEIRSEKHEHSPTVSWRTRIPAGFYSEDWDELQQEDYKWQVPDKWQRISQMVFCGGCL